METGQASEGKSRQFFDAALKGPSHMKSEADQYLAEC